MGLREGHLGIGQCTPKIRMLASQESHSYIVFQIFEILFRCGWEQWKTMVLTTENIKI